MPSARHGAICASGLAGRLPSLAGIPDPEPGPEAGESVAGEEDPGAAEDLPLAPDDAPAAPLTITPPAPVADPAKPRAQAGAWPTWI